MKRLNMILPLLLLLLSLVGCGTHDAGDVPSNPAIIEPSTTGAVEEIVSLPDWLPEEFALLDAREDGETFYRYTGTDRDVEFPFYGMTLHLLPEWDGLVDVLIRVPVTGERMVYVVNRELMQEHQKLHPEKGPAYGMFDPVLWVMAGEDSAYYLNAGCRSVTAGTLYYSMNCNGTSFEFNSNPHSPTYWLNQEKAGEKEFIYELRAELLKDDRYYDRIVGKTRCSVNQLFHQIVDIHQITQPDCLPESFELIDLLSDGERYYRYTGTDTEIPMEGLGVTLHLPQEWANRTEVLIKTIHGDNFYVYVVNRELLEAHNQAMGYTDRFSAGYFDYALWLAVESKNYYPDTDSYLGTNGTWYYRIGTNEDPENYGGHSLELNGSLILRIGQDAYDALRRELVCTHEQALEIVEIHGLQ